MTGFKSKREAALDKEAMTRPIESDYNSQVAYTRALEAYCDTLAQPEQHQDWCASLTQILMSMPPKPASCNCKPPQRTWVGLSWEEIDECFKITPDQYLLAQIYRRIEAKLKERNHGT